MFTDAAREFLKKPLTARMSTIDENGYPHTVPVWFMLDGDEVVVFGERKTRKVKHIRANPKGAVAVGGDPSDKWGYMIKGEFSLEEDPQRLWAEKITLHYEGEEQGRKDLAAWAHMDLLVMRLKPKQVIKVMEG